MKYDLILAGVGGQGVLSVATAIALGAMKDGLQVRQSEVHGMAQRGGAVQAHLRLSDAQIYGDLVGKASAQLILAMEPLEALRYLAYLRPDGVLVAAAEPFKNIGNYPEVEAVYAEIRRLPQHRLVEAAALAREAGAVRATNMVMVGAASGFLPIREASLLEAIEERFAGKGESVVAVNRAAFALGKEAVAAAARQEIRHEQQNSSGRIPGGKDPGRGWGLPGGEEEFGNSIMKELKDKGYRVYPINPHAEMIGGERCYASLQDLPERPGGVITVIPPAATEAVVREAKAAGIKRIWMQQGSESEAAIRYCTENGIEVVHGECIMMFAEPVGSIHRFHRWIWKLFGKLPK